MKTTLKTIRSHVGMSRFLAEVSDEPVREIPRDANIPSPYAYSPTHNVWQWGNREIIIVETSHKVYKIFDANS